MCFLKIKSYDPFKIITDAFYDRTYTGAGIWYLSVVHSNDSKQYKTWHGMAWRSMTHHFSSSGWPAWETVFTPKHLQSLAKLLFPRETLRLLKTFVTSTKLLRFPPPKIAFTHKYLHPLITVCNILQKYCVPLKKIVFLNHVETCCDLCLPQNVPSLTKLLRFPEQCSIHYKSFAFSCKTIVPPRNVTFTPKH